MNERIEITSADRFFSGIQRQPRAFLLGDQGEHEFLFPTFFRRSQFVNAGFLCDRRAASALLPSDLRPLKIFPGRAVVAFTAYRHVELEEMEPYNEAVISIPSVRQGGTRMPLLPLLKEEKFCSFGHYVFHMPVNSALNQARGEHIWGLPKVMAEITFESTTERFICEVEQDGKRLFSLSAPTQGRAVDFGRRMQIFSELDSALHITRSIVDARMAINKPFKGGNFASVSLGDHPVAKRLRSLGPLSFCMESRFAKDFRSILELPLPASDLT